VTIVPDETAPPKKPIFFGITRSFWLGILPLLLTAFDGLVALSAFMLANEDNITPIAMGIAGIFGWETESVSAFMRFISPVFGLIIAHQRSGAARPYALMPNEENVK
jgi:hypothetical protein